MAYRFPEHRNNDSLQSLLAELLLLSCNVDIVLQPHIMENSLKILLSQDAMVFPFRLMSIAALQNKNVFIIRVSSSFGKLNVGRYQVYKCNKLTFKI